MVTEAAERETGPILDGGIFVEPPVINTSADISYSYPDSGYQAWWRIDDASVLSPTYALYCNGSWEENDTWGTGDYIYYDVGGLDVGIYNYTLFADDGIGGISQATVLVTVLNVAPSITCGIINITYVAGETGQVLYWNVTDLSTASTNYTINRNGTQVKTDFWTTGDELNCSVDGLYPGAWNYTLVLDDGYGGVSSHSVAGSVCFYRAERSGFVAEREMNDAEHQVNDWISM